jgi:hypothetical protein
MKKTFFIAMLCTSFAVSKAQNYDDVTKYLTLGHPENAKPEIDKLMADPKAFKKPDTWFYKGAVYAAIYAKPDLRDKFSSPELSADSALRTYEQMDTSLAMIKTYMFGPQPYADMYSTSFSLGIKTFNAKKWDSASHYFALAEFYSEYLFKRKLTTSTGTFDTSATEYAGFAYHNNKQLDVAMKYYKILADHKVSGDDFKDMYANMLNYYSQQKDNNNFQAILAEVRELYPAQSNLWDEYNAQNMADNMSLDDIAAKYKQEDAAGKLTTAVQYGGYAETFASITKDQLSKIDSAKQVDYKYLAADAYSKGFNLNNNGLFAFNAGIMYYNVYTTLDDRFYNLRGESAALKAQRSVVEKQEFVLADSSIIWLTKAYNILKAKTDRTKSESISLNRTVDFLANIYSWERDKNRGVNPSNVDKYDALFKQFDAEHDKYKQ